MTATTALLQQYAEPRINASQSGWNTISPRRHEVMKAVLMNSADKFIDDGTVTFPGGSTPIPRGRLLGMDRTVLTQTNGTWFNSDAYPDQFGLGNLIPLDLQMGAGHVNIRRALQQFRNGEFEHATLTQPNPVPMIGWDFGRSNGTVQKYKFNNQLLGGSFISATLAYDRFVPFDIDNGTADFFEPGDTFEEYSVFNPPADDQISDLDLYLMPAGATNINQASAVSDSPDSTIEHMFFQIPMTGNYELWVDQFDTDVGLQDYALAWWAVTSVGDFNGDGAWNCTDVNALSAAIATGSTNLTFDMNKDGLINLNDITDVRSGWLTAAGAIATLQTSGLPFLHADANLDGVTDGSDFGIWNANKFTFDNRYCFGDFNANGVVDASDFGIWNANKNQASATVQIVPEPTTISSWLPFFIFFLAIHVPRSTGRRTAQQCALGW